MLSKDLYIGRTLRDDPIEIIHIADIPVEKIGIAHYDLMAAIQETRQT
jgi:hypothetical protein